MSCARLGYLFTMLEARYQGNVYQSCLVNFSLSRFDFRKRKEKIKKEKDILTTQRCIQNQVEVEHLQ